MSDDHAAQTPPAVAAYWEAVEDGVLAVPVCEQCDGTFFPPRAVCPYCLSTDVRLRESNGVGEVYSFSVVHSGIHPLWQDRTPYVNALVALGDGPVVFTNVVDCDPADVSVGMAVEVRFREVGEWTLPLFVPR